ncbi:MAG: hypothetical protein ACI9TF_000103 [Paracrocinitomix sp.]|jgi:hypothetical protein
MSKFPTFDRSHRRWPTKVIVTTENPDARGERQCERDVCLVHLTVRRRSNRPRKLSGTMDPASKKLWREGDFERLTEGAYALR